MASPAVAGASEENCNNNDSCIIEIPKEMEPELDDRKNIIYRVPRNLRKLKEAVYTPSLISIGPFHHGKRELQAMESHKHSYYERFCNRPERSRDDLERVIKEKCEEVHHSYAGTMAFEKNDPKFEKMILIDACFIIELFLRNIESKADKGNNDKKTSNEDYILRTAWLKKAIQQDLILLENQLPYFLLKELFQTTKPNRATSSSSTPGGTPDNINDFLSIACDFFKDFGKRSDQNNEIKHFTDLVRQFRLPKYLQGSKFGDNHLYSATELDKAGVSFVVNEEARLTDVKLPPKCYYKRLELPKLELNDATELLFRNMIALEQCLYSDKAYICSYVALMSQLIKTKEDADLLVEKKIIKNISSRDEAELFTSLIDEISFSKFWYDGYCKTLNDYCETWLNRTLTKAKKVYFNDLWKTSSTVVGFFVLLFTIISLVETIFSFCPYV